MACNRERLMNYRGRKKIYAKYDDITVDNVADAVTDAMMVHSANVNDIQYLYDYYRGDQPVLYREKSIREDILNTIVINRAYEIVNFKRGYLLTEAIQYIRNDRGEEFSDEIKKLNDYMKREGKETKDSVLAEWMYICGVGYRVALPKRWIGKKGVYHEENESPFEFYTLDPREVFVAYSKQVGNAPVYACIKSNPAETDDDADEYTVYTETTIFSVKKGKVISVEDNPLGMIPVIEYPENNARLGSFEIVMTILDAINNAQSNRLDDIEQQVQSLLVLIGVDLAVKDDEGNDVSTIESIRENGGISLPADTDAKFLSCPLTQGTADSFIKDLEQAWITICGLPNRNGKNSTSDTGSAVYMRDGHAEAEVRAMNTESMWKQSENKFLKVILRIINQVQKFNITADDIIPHFNRQNAINLQSKTQSFCELMNNGWTDLRDALKFSGIAYDVESAYENGMKWHDEQEQKQIEQLQLSMQQQNAHDDSDSEEVDADE